MDVFLCSGLLSHCRLLSSECPFHATENSTTFHANLCTSLNSFNRDHHKGQEMRRDQSKIGDDLTPPFSLSPVAVKTETRGLGASLLCAGNQSMMGRSMRARVCVIKWMWKETSFQKRPACYNLGFCFFKCPCMFSAFSN